MKVSIKSLTKKQLSEIVSCYARAFTDWNTVSADRLIRFNGPLLQQIGFEVLRSGAYRPSSAIRVLIAPNVVLLPQFLDISHREIFLREHPTKWERVVLAMEEQIRPSVRKPLEVKEVIELCTSLAAGSANDICGLSALNAYVGNYDGALEYCRLLDEKMFSIGRPLEEWEELYWQYTKGLATAILEGGVDSFLQAHTVNSNSGTEKR